MNWKSTHFWGALLLKAVLLVAFLADKVSANEAVVGTAAASVAYIISRVFGKIGKALVHRGVQTTEFYVAAVSLILLGVYLFGGFVGGRVGAGCMATVYCVYAVGRGLIFKKTGPIVLLMK